MSNYVNYRYHDFQNQSFQNEFRKGEEKEADFTGSRLKSCDFRGASLVGADFSETEIGRDAKSFQWQIMQMFLHIIAGLPIGLVTWLVNQAFFRGGDGGGLDPYGWINPLTWIAAFSAAATISDLALCFLYWGLVGLMAVLSAGVPLLLMAFGVSLFGLYLGYKKGSIAVGIVWMTVGVSSAISAGYSWIKLQQIYAAIFFAILTIIPAILATRAFNLHSAKIKLSAMTSFNGADLTNARFVNAVLENCDFLGANLVGVDWHGATFKNCKFSQGWSKEFQEAHPLVEKLPVN